MACAPSVQVPRVALVGIAVLAVFAGGCTIPSSEHPLSDEKTSTLDQRLIGHWEFADAPSQNLDPSRFVVGRDANVENVLEYAAASLNGEQKIEIHRGRLFVTKIGEAHYLSFDGGDPKQGFSIMRYDFKPHSSNAQEPSGQDPGGQDKPSRDTVELHLMVDTVIAEAIDKGELAGKVTREKSSRRLQEIRITAAPEDLKAFLEKRSETCFSPEAVKMVRVNSDR
jgi:hypothetical protein